MSYCFLARSIVPNMRAHVSRSLGTCQRTLTNSGLLPVYWPRYQGRNKRGVLGVETTPPPGIKCINTRNNVEFDKRLHGNIYQYIQKQPCCLVQFLGFVSQKQDDISCRHQTRLLRCKYHRFIYSLLDAVPPIHAESSHVATDKVPSM